MIRWRFFGKTVFVLVAAVVFAAAATFLPDNPYQRFQLLDHTLYERVRYFYERMHFDPRPIDVAIIGDSKTLQGIRSVEIERRLAAAGKSVQVVNMSQVGAGRNSQWVLVQELLKTKQPKVIVLAINDHPNPWGHDSFKYIAPASEVRREARLGLYDTNKDLPYLAFRQLELFTAMVIPGAFGLEDHFDAAHYAATPRDTPERQIRPNGQFMDFGLTLPRTTLLQQVHDNRDRFDKVSKLPARVRAITDADDKVYMDLIAHAAAKRGIKLLFVYEPMFHQPRRISNRSYYEGLGAIQDNSDIGDQDPLYHDYAHLNTAGAIVVSDRVGDVLAKMLP